VKVFVTAFPPENYECAIPVGDGDTGAMIDLDGTPHASKWRPIELELCDANDTDTRKLKKRPLPADLPASGSGRQLVLKQRAYDAVGAFLSDFGELLPARAGTEPLWVFNCTTNIAAFDLDRSDVQYLKNTKRVFRVMKYVFHADRLPARGVFFIEGLRMTPLFYMEDAVEHFKRHKLTGEDFKLVWEG